MKLQNRTGEIIEVELTADHPLSSYGLEILVDDCGNAFGSLETLGWIIEDATASERRRLYCAGYQGVVDIEREIRR